MASSLFRFGLHDETIEATRLRLRSHPNYSALNNCLSESCGLMSSFCPHSHPSHPHHQPQPQLLGNNIVNPNMRLISYQNQQPLISHHMPRSRVHIHTFIDINEPAAAQGLGGSPHLLLSQPSRNSPHLLLAQPSSSSSLRARQEVLRSQLLSATSNAERFLGQSIFPNPTSSSSSSSSSVLLNTNPVNRHHPIHFGTNNTAGSTSRVNKRAEASSSHAPFNFQRPKYFNNYGHIFPYRSQNSQPPTVISIESDDDVSSSDDEPIVAEPISVYIPTPQPKPSVYQSKEPTPEAPTNFRNLNSPNSDDARRDQSNGERELPPSAGDGDVGDLLVVPDEHVDQVAVCDLGDGKTRSLKHDKNGPYTCSKCRRVFETSQFFASHSRSIHPRSPEEIARGEALKADRKSKKRVPRKEKKQEPKRKKVNKKSASMKERDPEPKQKRPRVSKKSVTMKEKDQEQVVAASGFAGYGSGGEDRTVTIVLPHGESYSHETIRAKKRKARSMNVPAAVAPDSGGAGDGQVGVKIGKKKDSEKAGPSGYGGIDFEGLYEVEVQMEQK
ncbi:unnamed protein product [Prunus armeniaca]|uniref:C2H2-type domain-containing protein n=1 Tax=Prunus armeniaca TaxID=36596 RepID=A0A6J5XF46_PRUAR|nr:unnamed protein product [Prunus armeniaca]